MAKKKDPQNDLTQSAHKIWLAGLGAVAMAEEDGGKLLKSRVERGKVEDLTVAIDKMRAADKPASKPRTTRRTTTTKKTE